MNLKDLIQRRTALAGQARHIVTAAQTASRDLTAEERSQYDGLMSQIKTVNGDIERLQQLSAIDGELDMPIRAANVPQNIGMSQAEVRQYSIVRALRAAADGNWALAPFEREVSDTIAAQTGKAPRSFWVPNDWASQSVQEIHGLGDAEMRSLATRVARIERRDLTVGTPSAGGYTVQTDLLTDSFIGLLRNRMVVRRAGATVLADLTGNVAIPAQTGGATAYWVAESGAPTESQQTVGQVAMTPKTVGAYTDISRRLLAQSSLDVEAFVRGDLATVLAIAMDLAALHGTGASNQPTGVAATSGIGAVYAGGAATNGTNVNGAAPVWADAVNLESAVAVANADLGSLAYITNPKVRGKLKQTQIASNLPMIWQYANELNGYAAHVTSQVRSDLTKGAATTLSALFFGNWADLVIGMWGGLDVLVDPFTGATAGTVRVVELQDSDIAVRHAASFAVCVDANAG